MIDQSFARTAPPDKSCEQVFGDRVPGCAESAGGTSREMFWQASAVSGVFSDGFQITGSPQTKASAAFQPRPRPES